MARLNWSTIGERFYESGIDRGVLYVDDSGYAWSGLISVTESPSGGEPKPRYIDGVKYLNIASAEEFEATITAFSSPAEFAACDGTKSIHNGLFVTQQPRKSFDFAYRTGVGNDIDGIDHGYKIHLVYGALAGPSEREHATFGDEATAQTLSWTITTLPPKLTGFKPTAHFVIDSRSTPEELLVTIENILYGDDATSPRLPTVAELTDMFQNYAPPVEEPVVEEPVI